MNKPTLYIFSGLPATGKSTLAQELAKKVQSILGNLLEMIGMMLQNLVRRILLI
jgi:adenylylsulfate kinase-like enzyme